MYTQTTFDHLLSATSFPESADGVTRSGLQDGQTSGRCGQEAAPASHSAPPGSRKVKQTKGTSGRCSGNSSDPASLQSRLENRLQANLDVNGSPEYELTWKSWDMKSGAPICALRASARRTSDNAFIGWPTPQAHDVTGRSSGQKAKHGTKHGCSCLVNTANLAGWPSPMAGTPATHCNNEAGNTDSSRKTVDLVGWPTPDTNNRGGAQDPKKRKSGGHSVTLQDAATLAGWNTPRATDGSNGGPNQAGGALSADAAGAILTSSTAPMEKRGALNPAHSRWLMGFPAAWDSCGATAMQSCRKSRRRSSRPQSKP